MSWYRTYRPKTLSGLHLTSVRESLQALVKRGHLSQVLLFAGPKGTGKTSTARILAAMVNDPANSEQAKTLFSDQASKPLTEPDSSNELVQRIHKGSALMLHELDAASHRGIDDVRILKESVVIPPQEGVISVYILDEVHMLTTEAFNALLKLLEEPPAQVLFILATTELHKIPATVASRCTLIQFTKASNDEIVAALTPILEQEKVEFEPEALKYLADQADGSFRDGVKWLELVAHEAGKVSVEAVQRLVNPGGHLEVTKLIQAILSKEPTQVVKVFETLRQTDANQVAFEKNLCQWLHRAIMQNLGIQTGKPEVSERVAQFLLSELLTAMGQVTNPVPFLSLELKCLELVFRAQDKSGSKPSATKTSSSKDKPNLTDSKVASSDLATTQLVVEVKANSSIATVSPLSSVSPELIPSPELSNLVFETSPIDSPPDSTILPNMSRFTSSSITEQPLVVEPSVEAVDPALAEALLTRWAEFVEGVKAHNGSLAAILKSAKPIKNDQGSTIIQVFYRFHQDQLKQPKFFNILHESAQKIVGQPVQILVELASQPQPTPEAASTVSQPSEGGQSADSLATLAAEALV
jgi:DNA polymerase III subunit gamma/tau